MKVEDFVKDIVATDNVYYSKKFNKLFHVKAEGKFFNLCSGFTSYYNDSRTNICRQRLSSLFINKCVKINNVDECEFLHYDGIGWWAVKEPDETKEKLAKIITESSLWNLGKDSHNALSELVETIYNELF